MRSSESILIENVVSALVEVGTINVDLCACTISGFGAVALGNDGLVLHGERVGSNLRALVEVDIERRGRNCDINKLTVDVSTDSAASEGHS